MMHMTKTPVTRAVAVILLAMSAAFGTSAMAKAAKSKRHAKGVREKNITREAVIKGKNVKKIDFDSVDINGQTKTPMGSMVSDTKNDKNYDFVRIRLRWYPEMVQSASSLDSGRTR